MDISETSFHYQLFLFLKKKRKKKKKFIRSSTYHPQSAYQVSSSNVFQDLADKILFCPLKKGHKRGSVDGLAHARDICDTLVTLSSLS